MSKITMSDEHETKKNIPSEHQLNERMKQRLIEYYHPFDTLLQQFMNKVRSTPTLILNKIQD